MEIEWENMDRTALQALYEQQFQQLSSALLDGAKWEDVKQQRLLLTELSIFLDKRGGTANPAEHPERT